MLAVRLRFFCLGDFGSEKSTGSGSGLVEQAGSILQGKPISFITAHGIVVSTVPRKRAGRYYAKGPSNRRQGKSQGTSFPLFSCVVSELCLSAGVLWSAPLAWACSEIGVCGCLAREAFSFVSGSVSIPHSWRPC